MIRFSGRFSASRYLQEVVQILESDPDFRSKLESAGADKIRDGSIASELNLVNHNVRNKLDEIKRQEVERLRHMARSRGPGDLLG